MGLQALDRQVVNPRKVYGIVPADLITGKIYLVRFDESICVLSIEEIRQVDFESISKGRVDWIFQMFNVNPFYVDHRYIYDFK